MNTNMDTRYIRYKIHIYFLLASTSTFPRPLSFNKIFATLKWACRVEKLVYVCMPQKFSESVLH